MSTLLDKLNSACSFIQNITTINWGFIFTIASSFSVAILAKINQLGYLQLVIYTLVTFTCALFIYNGFIWLKSQKRPSNERLSFDYSYGLALEDIHVGLEGQEILQLGIKLKNTSGMPLKYCVKNIFMRIGDRVVPFPSFLNSGTVISTGMSSTYFYPPFINKEVVSSLDKKQRGTIEYTIEYGHPEIGFVRSTHKKLELTLLRVGQEISCLHLIAEESEESIPCLNKAFIKRKSVGSTSNSLMKV